MTMNLDFPPVGAAHASLAGTGEAGSAASKSWLRHGCRSAPRFVLALVVYLATLPVAGWVLPTAWFAVMVGVIAGSGVGARVDRLGFARLMSWLAGVGYSCAGLYLVLFHTGAAQTFGVTLYGVIIFQVLVREYTHPRRLFVDLIPPVLSIAFVQAAASMIRIIEHRPWEIVTLLASPVAVYWVFRSLQTSLTESRRRLGEATVRAEAGALRIQEAHRIAMMAEALSGIGHWRFDMETRRFVWSDGVFRIVGLDPSADVPDPESLPALWVPEDRERIAGLLARAVKHGTPFAVEASVLRPDGQVRRVVSNGAAERDTAGAIVTVFGAIMDVTEAREREAALGKSEERFRLLADKSNDIIMQTTITPDGDRQLVYISPAVERVLGYSPNEDPDARTLSYVHPDDAPDVLKANLAQIAEGPDATPQVNTYRARHKDGHWVWLEGKPTFTFDPDTGVVRGMITVMRDVTAQREAAAAIERSEARYRLLAENTTDVIVQVSEKGFITFITPACEALLGYGQDELIGSEMALHVHPDDLASLIDDIVRLVAAGPGAPPIVVQYRARHKDGHWIWIEGRPKIHFDAKGDYTSLQDVIRDVTERKAAEAELARAYRAAEAAAVAKSDFLANMSHEIRTPLTAILGFSDMLEQVGTLDEEARLYAHRIATGGRTLLSVVNDILDFSKLEAGQVELDPLPFEAAEMFEGVIDLVAAQAGAKGLRLAVQLAPDMPAFLKADSSRLRQVLLNLLSNAIKFTVEGGVTLSAAYDPEDQRLRVSVSDTGQGIPADKRDRLFERFSQVDGSINRRHGGTGLGLAISKNLVELMGGEIEVASEVGAGSTFSFTIRAPLAEALLPSALAAPLTADDDALASAHILVVDDLAENRELVRLMLEALGHRVEEAASGGEAVSTAAARAFDLILMDVQMPGMDGLTAARLIRLGQGRNSATPILALSANVMADQVDQCLCAGMNDHVAKPLQVADLVAKVTFWAGRDCDEPPLEDPVGAQPTVNA